MRPDAAPDLVAPGFAALCGWAGDDHAAAAAALASAAPDAGWPGLAGLNDAGASPRTVFETLFCPGAPISALLTGYYEPELAGARRPDARFRHALYRAPDGLGPDPDAHPWHARAAIEAGNLLAGHEIVWLDDPVEAFLAQVQGSVRVRLTDGTLLRLGHGGRNGHPYRSIGKELVRRGAIAAETVSAGAIRDWCAANPAHVPALLAHNPSFCFFRILDLAPDSGPVGSAGVSLTAWRSLAVDPGHLPLGTPVWVEGTAGPGAEHLSGRLMIAQDTGSAIRGPARADVFCGSGDAAARVAGPMRATGRLTPLWPRAGGRG